MLTTTRRTEVNDLPPIEQNQFVSRKSPVLTQLSSKQSEEQTTSVQECDLERKAKEAETIEDEVVGTDLTSGLRTNQSIKKRCPT